MAEVRETVDQEALEGWGRRIGELAVRGSLRLPLVVALRGPLGSGKSVLARAVARGAGVHQAMPSPTYNLVFTYEGERGVRVHHLDLYRLEDADDVWELGWRELGEGEEIVLIEWPERAEALLVPDRWEVRLSFVEGGSDPDTGGAGDDADRDGRRGAPPRVNAGASHLRRVTMDRLGSAPELIGPGGSAEDGR